MKFKLYILLALSVGLTTHHINNAMNQTGASVASGTHQIATVVSEVVSNATDTTQALRGVHEAATNGDIPGAFAHGVNAWNKGKKLLYYGLCAIPAYYAIKNTYTIYSLASEGDKSLLNYAFPAMRIACSLTIIGLMNKIRNSSDLADEEQRRQMATLVTATSTIQDGLTGVQTDLNQLQETAGKTQTAVGQLNEKVNALGVTAETTKTTLGNVSEKLDDVAKIGNETQTAMRDVVKSIEASDARLSNIGEVQTTHTTHLTNIFLELGKLSEEQRKQRESSELAQSKLQEEISQGLVELQATLSRQNQQLNQLSAEHQQMFVILTERLNNFAQLNEKERTQLLLEIKTLNAQIVTTVNGAVNEIEDRIAHRVLTLLQKNNIRPIPYATEVVNEIAPSTAIPSSSPSPQVQLPINWSTSSPWRTTSAQFNLHTGRAVYPSPLNRGLGLLGNLLPTTGQAAEKQELVQ